MVKVVVISVVKSLRNVIQTGNLVGWSWKTLINLPPKAHNMEVTFREWKSSTLKLVTERKLVVQDCAAPPHDWFMTRDYYVWVQYGLALDLLPCVLGLKGPGECMVPKKGGKAIVHLVPRPHGRKGGEEALAIEVGNVFMTHWSNGFQIQNTKKKGAAAGEQEGEEKIVAYSCGWGEELLLEANEDGKLFGELAGYAPDSRLPIIRLHRLEVDLKSRTGKFTLVPEMEKTFVDFPKVGG